MTAQPISRLRASLIWFGFVLAVAVPSAGAGVSPLLAWRDPIYILAGFAGVVAMALLLAQPLLIAGYLPGLSQSGRRRVHLWVGAGLVVSVAIHVAALWLTSPPDVVDALLFSSPTAFSVWGVIAMWAVFSAAAIAMARHRLRLSPRSSRRIHTTLAAIVVIGAVVHAILIDGTMETVSKFALCLLVILATLKAFIDLNTWKLWWPPRRRGS